jgi:radical SAM protein with 4Fe4S-binding SPASM domain
VSLDGATAETHEALRGVAGCFRRALEGLEHLVKAGLYVQVIAAGYEGNKHELTRLVDLCAAQRVSSFKVCFVHPAGRAKNLPLIDREEAAAIDARMAERVKDAGMHYCSSLPPALQSVTQIITSCTFSSRCNITSSLGILADGTITVCGMGRHATDFRFGNLAQDDVADVWKNHATLKLLREGIPDRLQGICGRCIVRSACQGYCRLENEDVTLRTFFDPFPRCAEMDRLNRFPQSRIVDRSPTPAVAVARERDRPGAPYLSAT